jgi:glycogen phosphorylase
VETKADHHLFAIEICLDDLDPNAVRVALYADGLDGGDPLREEVKCAQVSADATRRYAYQVAVRNTRPANDYTVRLIPQRFGVPVPLEALESSGNDDENSARRRRFPGTTIRSPAPGR